MPEAFEIRPENRVNNPSVAFTRMCHRWRLIIALGSGTLGMREAGTEWLPQEPNEKDAQYQMRLSRSVLFNGFEDAVTRIVERPFSKSIEVENLPERLSFLADDADGQGTHIHDFASDLLDSAIRFGKVHVLVDFPALPSSRTLADDRKFKARPTFSMVTADSLIGWRYEMPKDGSFGLPALTQIRIQEFRTEPVGAYGDGEVEYIRVINRESWELHRRVTGGTREGEFVLVEEGAHTFGDIPLVTFYTNRTGFLVAEPPLEDLAWANLAHWQSSSDQRNILRFARLGILFAKGLDDEDIEGGITISPTNVIATTNVDADLKYVEHSGEAVKAGERDIEKLEQHMETLGMEPLLQRSGNRTATERAINEANTDSAIQAWIRGLERSLLLMFEYAARWVGVNLPEDFDIDIYNEFGTAASSTTHIDAILKLWLAGEITPETAIAELKRRGVFRGNIDPEEEAQKAADRISVNKLGPAEVDDEIPPPEDDAA